MEALWIVIAYAMGMLAKWCGLPSLVGYLVAGFALSALHPPEGHALDAIAHVGVLLLLFTVGLKLELKYIVRADVVGIGGLSLLGFGAVVMVLGLGWKLSVMGLVLVALSLAFSSTVLALKLLENRKELSTYHGRLMMGVLVLQDIFAVAILSVSSGVSPSPWALLLLLLPLLRPVWLWLLGRSGHEDLLVVFGVGMALSGAALAGMVHISEEIGALAMGAVLAGHAKTAELSKQLWALKETFLVGFFLTIGLGGLPDMQHMGMVLAVVLTMGIKAALFFWLMVRFGLRARTAFVSALGLCTFSEFALITTQALVQHHIVPEHFNAVMGLSVALSLAIAAPINQHIHRVYNRFEPWLHRFERTMEHPDKEPTDLGGAAWLVIGMGRTGGAVYKMLESQGQHVVGMDADASKITRHENKGRNMLYGDAEDSELWTQLDLSTLKGVVLTLPDVEAKVEALEGLRLRGFTGVRAVTSYHLDEEPLMHKAGATLMFRPFAEAGERLGERVLQETLAVS